MRKPRAYKIITWILVGLLGYLALREFYWVNVMAYVGDQVKWESRRYIGFLVSSGLAGLAWSLAGVVLLRSGKAIRVPLPELPLWVRWTTAALATLLPGLFKWFLPLPANFTFGYWQELLLIFLLALLAAWLTCQPQESNPARLLRLSTFILAAGAAHAILLKLAQVTPYPFPLYWSEGNRYFDYSTLFGSFRYNFPPGEEIYAFISWGMQLPWALPFLVPSLSIGAFRLWYQWVWIIPPLLLGLSAVWKKPSRDINMLIPLIFAFWAFLFLDQGPIYAPLVIAGILTIWAARARLPLGAALVLLASFYARNARWTWSFSPGLLAGMLALLAAQSPDFSKTGRRQLVRPLVLGLSGYLGGQILPPIIKQMSTATVMFLPDVVTSTTRQPLLWQRLYPNPTYPPGILYGLLWAALPLVILLLVLLMSRTWKVTWLQGMALFSIGAAYLAVGLIASVKIGGGSNLHNLDNFLVTLVMMAAAALAHLREKEFNLSKHVVLTALTCLALVSPVTFALQGGARLSLPTHQTTNETLAVIQGALEKYQQQGEVLFIDQRQLLTFGLVPNVPLVDEYEKKVLMDQAMAENAKYFQAFHQDLQAHRFALIVSEPGNYIIRGSEHSFGEENNAYVKWVTVPLLCTYEPFYTSPQIGVELLVPRSEAPADIDCSAFLD